MKRASRQYSKSFIEDTVALVHSSSKCMSKIAEELKIPKSTLKGWVNKSIKNGQSAFDNVRELTPEEAEISRLRKELAETQMERDILKKAVGIFSKTQR